MKSLGGIIVLIVVLVGGYFLITQAPVTDTVEYGLTLETNIEALEEGTYEVWAKFGAQTVLLGEIEGGKGKYSFDTQETSLLEASEIMVTLRAGGMTPEMKEEDAHENDEEEDAHENDEEIEENVEEADEEMEESVDEEIEEESVTEEEVVDYADAPRVVVLSGVIAEDGSVELSFPMDFTGSEGNFILATPTNGADTDETSGIWFLALGEEGPETGLTLPALAAGWVYEGWVVSNGTPLTSGRFNNVAAKDFFDGFSGEEEGPEFPGEDYLVNAPEGFEFPLELADGETIAVISVEPDIEGVDPTGVGPFQVKVLLGEIAEEAADHENIALSLDTNTVPAGSGVAK